MSTDRRAGDPGIGGGAPDERWVPVKSPGDTHDAQGSPEQWSPVIQGHPSGAPPERPEELFRRFFEMRRIPKDTEVIVAPSMRAAMDVPLKVLLVLFLLFGPFTATGFFVDPLFMIAPLAILHMILQFWPLLIFVFAPAVRLRFTRYIVDAEGIRSRTQVLSVTEERVSWDKVTAIQYRRTLFDRLLGLERLSVIAYGERGATVRMIGLRNAKDLRDLTAQKMREYATAEAFFSSD